MFAGFLGTCAFPRLPCERIWLTAKLPTDRKLDLLSHHSHVEAGGSPTPTTTTHMHTCVQTHSGHTLLYAHTHTVIHTCTHNTQSCTYTCNAHTRTDTHLCADTWGPRSPGPPLTACPGLRAQCKVRELEEKCRTQSEQFSLLSRDLEQFRQHAGKIDLLGGSTVASLDVPSSPSKSFPRFMNGLAPSIGKGKCLPHFLPPSYLGRDGEEGAASKLGTAGHSQGCVTEPLTTPEGVTSIAGLGMVQGRPAFPTHTQCTTLDGCESV